MEFIKKEFIDPADINHKERQFINFDSHHTMSENHPALPAFIELVLSKATTVCHIVHRAKNEDLSHASIGRGVAQSDLKSDSLRFRAPEDGLLAPVLGSNRPSAHDKAVKYG